MNDILLHVTKAVTNDKKQWIPIVLCIHTCIYMYIYVYVHICIHTHIYIYVCTRSTTAIQFLHMTNIIDFHDFYMSNFRDIDEHLLELPGFIFILCRLFRASCKQIHVKHLHSWLHNSGLVHIQSTEDLPLGQLITSASIHNASPPCSMIIKWLLMQEEEVEEQRVCNIINFQINARATEEFVMPMAI
jgi:hypothetical protein